MSKIFQALHGGRNEISDLFPELMGGEVAEPEAMEPEPISCELPIAPIPTPQEMPVVSRAGAQTPTPTEIPIRGASGRENGNTPKALPVVTKAFEGLQRLERESDEPSGGRSVPGQRGLQNGAVDGAAKAESGHTGIAAVAGMPAGAPVEAPSVELDPAFGLEQIRVETAAITAKSRIVYHTDPHGPGADRFRLLRMSLTPLRESGKLKTLLITSAQAQDGKSTVALNLATALAEHGTRKVLLIEGDLHHPSLEQRLGLEEGDGLAECLEDAVNPLDLLRRVDPLGCYLLAAGTPRGNPSELLQSPIGSDVFRTIRRYFDWIVLDSPPVVPLTDTLSLKQYVDAALFVVRAGRTPRDAVEAGIRSIGKPSLVGVVLNGAEELDRLYSRYHGYYSTMNGRKGKKPRR